MLSARARRGTNCWMISFGSCSSAEYFAGCFPFTSFFGGVSIIVGDGGGGGVFESAVTSVAVGTGFFRMGDRRPMIAVVVVDSS